MATWRAENSMLTQQGIEILNKLKVGSGSITISKILASSGRVSESRLFTQTSLSGKTMPMGLSNHSIKDSGSEISIYINNEGFTESFELHQIGIFVTHPDYEGEILYHISQCDSEDFDTIPALDETPVTFGYSIFLEHGNSSNVSITFDPEGMVNIEAFENFKKNIVPECLVSADSNGNLQSAGKSASELCNPNLLLNSFFISPVNRNNGYIVPPGTPYYSDTELTIQAGTTTLYNPVTQINTTYGVMIVSGKAHYVSWGRAIKGYAKAGITIDNWKLTSSPNSYALIEDDGVTFGNTGSVIEYVQHNSGFNPKHAIGRRLTLSALTASGQLLTTTSAEYKGGENWGLASVSVGGSASIYIATNGTTYFGVQMTIIAKQSIKLKALKLEFGTQQTLAHKDANGNWVLNEIPNISEEMAKCAQFDLTTGNYIGFNFAPSPTGGGTLNGYLYLKSKPNGYGVLFKNHSTTNDYGTELQDYDEDGNKVGIVLTAYQDPKNGHALVFKHNDKVYRLYGEHNKHLISASEVYQAEVIEE